MTTTVLGLDIGKKAWAVAALNDSRPDSSLQISLSTLDYQADLPEFDLAVIDVPIVLLPDKEARRTPKGLSGMRPCDHGAKRWSRTASSIFVPPTLGQLESAAKEIARAEKEGRRPVLSAVQPGGLSQQGLSLVPAIFSAHRHRGAHPGEVFEGFPEATFTALAGDKPRFKKTFLAGALERCHLIARELGMDLQDVLDRVTEAESRTQVPFDDWIDAMAMAITAHAWAQGGRIAIVDTTGRAREIPKDETEEAFIVLPRA